MAKAERRPTQCQRIIAYIKQHGSITPMDAYHKLGITKLSTRVSEMRRHQGIEFHIVMEKGKNQFGEPSYYARYSLKEVEINENKR
jgi:hypothetical protein